MEPLASLNGLPQTQALAAAPTFTGGDGSREESAVKAAGKERPVELLPDRVDGSEPPAPGGRAAGAASEPSRSDVLRIGVPGAENDEGRDADEDDGEDSRSPARADLSDAGVSSRNQGVTYRIYPELSISQSRVVDRQTEETLRAVPPDPRIQLAERFQQYIGQQLDRLA